MSSKHIPPPELYKQYYLSQAQRGGGAYFSGKLFQQGYGQRGRGIGSILGGLFKRALPFLSSASKTIGKAALKTGANVLADTVEGRDFGNSLRNRMRETSGELKRNAANQVLRALNNQTGSGTKRKRKRPRSKTPAIKRRKSTKSVRSSKAVKQRRSPKAVKQRTFQDIFGQK